MTSCFSVFFTFFISEFLEVWYLKQNGGVKCNDRMSKSILKENEHPMLKCSSLNGAATSMKITYHIH